MTRAESPLHISGERSGHLHKLSDALLGIPPPAAITTIANFWRLLSGTESQFRCGTVPILIHVFPFLEFHFFVRLGCEAMDVEEAFQLVVDFLRRKAFVSIASELERELCTWTSESTRTTSK